MKFPLAEHKYFMLFMVQVLLSMKLYGQNPPIIIHSDIDRFWVAYDQLKDSNNYQDSVFSIQTHYIDKASPGLREFIKARDISAESLINRIKTAPNYWETVRPNTYLVKNYQKEIASQLDLFRSELKSFRDPMICFAIGQLSTGGTVKGRWLLIGTEMVTSDSLTDKSQLTDWHKNVLPKEPKILEFTAHELVHTQQRFGLGYIIGYFRNRLLTMTITEGAADFVSYTITGLNINEDIYPYGYENEEALWKEFSEEMYGNAYLKWLYGGDSNKDRPADLGYFIGFRICEAYYNQAKNKKRALNKIVKTNNYRRLLRKSGYAEKFD
ncbi:hypothetical protein [Arthrospiribacter ruber]|uniref:DUF2268 domain-containing protein n=1 Tax=Arthrospiribacter ruber TaxID=2487934 RepID=A0A951IVC4_9BACT|nr:hypothetical protein [Arthrospiribacter ruber]MBW3466697.1 hypothetical protein [Arthrospiribacter ruber]